MEEGLRYLKSESLKHFCVELVSRALKKAFDREHNFVKNSTRKRIECTRCGLVHDEFRERCEGLAIAACRPSFTWPTHSAVRKQRHTTEEGFGHEEPESWPDTTSGL